VAKLLSFAAVVIYARRIAPAPVAKRIQYLFGQRKDRASNPGLTICMS